MSLPDSDQSSDLKSDSKNILSIKNLKKYFPVKKGFFKKTVGSVKAVDDITFEIKKGTSLGLVGESGCGKSTLGRSIIRLYEPTSGEVQFKGEDFLKLSGSQLRKARKEIQMIFQDPFASLDPRMTVGQLIKQPLQIHGIGTDTEQNQRVEELLPLVGLRPNVLNRYPHEFSGGQRQRISIARAIALNPQLVICDEPVSALDVSIQAQIINLLKDLQDKLGLTYLFISHDLSVVEYFCDEVAVMYLGKIVEKGPRDEVFTNPKHPYTQALISAVPRIGEGKKSMKRSLSGEVPSPLNPPTGCAFHPRCPSARPECSLKEPIYQTLPGTNHDVKCWLY